MNLESNCTNYNSSCDPTILSCQFISSLAKSKAVKLEFFNSEEAMSTALGRAELRASVKVIHTNLFITERLKTSDECFRCLSISHSHF